MGPAAQQSAPGTEALGRLFEAAGGRVLILCDEVLNFCNRHRNLTDGFYAFLQNLTVAMTGTTHSAAVISLPRSQVEMTDWDLQWQDKITKVVRRVAKDLIANDEGEISEVVRRRLFETLGPEKHRRRLPRYTRTGVSSGARNSHRNGRRWILPQPERKRGSSCGTGLKPVFRFIRRRSRYSKESGKPCRSINRHAGRWRCWRSGCPGLSPNNTRNRR